MVAVEIRKGALTEDMPLLDTPVGQWAQLVELRRKAVLHEFGHDCRRILEWTVDAGRMWKSLGYESKEHLIAQGLGLNPEHAAQVADWIRRYNPGIPVPWEEAKQQALGKHGGDRRSDEFQVRDHELERRTQTQDVAYLRARLARDHPDILERLDAGEYRSTRAAAIDAGIIDPDKGRRFSVPVDPVKAAQYLSQRCDQGWWDLFGRTRLNYRVKSP